jgi:hypothetical protein
MIDSNTCPFCSKLTRCVTGVLGLKKASQFVLIWVTAAAEAPLDGAAEVAGAADVGAAGELAEALGLALPLLLHAVTAMTVPKANTSRNLRGCNRMRALLWLERRTKGPQHEHPV